LANLPALIPSVKRNRERKALILNLGRRREFWREVIDELERMKTPRHVSKEILEGSRSVHEIEDDENDRIDLDIKRAREKCNTASDTFQRHGLDMLNIGKSSGPIRKKAIFAPPWKPNAKNVVSSGQGELTTGERLLAR
jgi:hypothetical protein